MNSELSWVDILLCGFLHSQSHHAALQGVISYSNPEASGHVESYFQHSTGGPFGEPTPYKVWNVKASCSSAGDPSGIHQSPGPDQPVEDLNCSAFGQHMIIRHQVHAPQIAAKAASVSSWKGFTWSLCLFVSPLLPLFFLPQPQPELGHMIAS